MSKQNFIKKKKKKAKIRSLTNQSNRAQWNQPAYAETNSCRSLNNVSTLASGVLSYSNQCPAGQKHRRDAHGSEDTDVTIGASQYTLIQYFYCIYTKLVTCRGCADHRMYAYDLWAFSAAMFITLWALINWRSALNAAGVSACWWRELQYCPRHMQISLRGQLLRTHTNAHRYSMKQQNLPLTTANISVAPPIRIIRLETSTKSWIWKI